MRYIVITILCFIHLIASSKSKDSTWVVSKELQPKISTDSNDSRLPLLTKQWYLKTDLEEVETLQFTTLRNDSAYLKIKFQEDGYFILKNKTNPIAPIKKGLWFLVNDKLYIEEYLSEKGKSSIYIIKELTDSSLVYSIWGTKNIYEAFLCDNEQKFFYTEVNPTFGNDPEDLVKYFAQNLDLSEEAVGIEADCAFEFTINCHGEVAEAKLLRDNGTSFEQEIIQLLRLMPKWEPAMQRDKTVNFSMKYVILFREGKLQLIKA